MENTFPLEVHVDENHPEHPDYTVLTLTGEVEIYTVPTYLKQHSEIIHTAKRGVVIDLRSTTYLDGTGCAWLIRMFKEARQIGKEFIIKVLPHGPVKRLFSITNLYIALPVEFVNN